jgi:hypothetical protein
LLGNNPLASGVSIVVFMDETLEDDGKFLRNRDQTADDIEKLSIELYNCAKSLFDLAGRMKIKRVVINVRHGQGMYDALRDTIKPFVADAIKKADRQGA